MTPKLIRPNGRITEIKPADGVSFTLEEMQKAVGGYVDVVYPPSAIGAILLINDEGKLKGLPMNEIATRMWKEQSPSWPDFIAGNAVLMPSEMFK